MMTMRVMLDIARAVPTTQLNRLVATDMSIVNIEAELAIGRGDTINRRKYAISTTLAGVLVDKEDQAAVTEHILLKRFAIDGADRDKYDSQNEFDSLYNPCPPMRLILCSSIWSPNFSFSRVLDSYHSTH